MRLHSGLDRLERWSRTAGQTEKNAVYKALFAVADGSVFWAYEVLDDTSRGHEFFVLVRKNLVVKICLHDRDTFGIVYIGSLHSAPDLDRGIDRVA